MTICQLDMVLYQKVCIRGIIALATFVIALTSA